VANTHLHLPPNFSAFATVEEAVTAGVEAGVRVLGASNFLDQRVYARFAAGCEASAIISLFGIEMITVLEDLRTAGIRVNDPSNPGRMYLCGKGIVLDDDPGGVRADLAGRVRAADENRMRLLVDSVAAVLRERGIPTAPGYDAIAAEVADAAGVPIDWVVLQERHVARAIQHAIWQATSQSDRRATLERLYQAEPQSVDDPAAVQAEIRFRLLKAGGPGFVAESPVPFELGYRLVLAAGGIPCYPILADGSDPVCEFEASPHELAQRILGMGIHAAELIPPRNAPEVVDAYVEALRAAGIIVLAGTEHNTPERIPLDPRCRGGREPSPAACAAFWEATCVVVAHQHRRTLGLAGFVGPDGVPDPADPDAESRIRHYAELGARHVASTELPR
jgi:hypothetical protein